MVLIVNDLVSAHTEDECVLLTNFLNDLYVCTVHGSKCRSTVQHELHVTCTGSLFTCSRNLLGNICCCKNQLSIGYSVVLNKYNFDLAINRRIVVYNICYAVDQFDNLFRALICCGCFCTKDEGSWIEIHLRM